MPKAAKRMFQKHSEPSTTQGDKSMSITSRILAFFGLGKEEISKPAIEKQDKPVARTAPVAPRLPPAPSAPPREQRPQPPQQATQSQTTDDGANIVMGAVLYSTIINSQSDTPPSPREHFQETHKPEPAQDHGSHDTGGTSTDYSPPPATDYGSGGGYGGGGFDSGSTFAPEFR